jgi:hypothetical protein
VQKRRIVNAQGKHFKQPFVVDVVERRWYSTGVPTRYNEATGHEGSSSRAFTMTFSSCRINPCDSRFARSPLFSTGDVVPFPFQLQVSGMN